VDARYPDINLSDLRLAITISRKSGKTAKPVLEFQCCTRRTASRNRRDVKHEPSAQPVSSEERRRSV